MNKKSILRISLTIAMSSALALAAANPAAGIDLINPSDPFMGKGVGFNVVDNYINNGHQASVIYGRNFSNGVFKGEKNCSDTKICDFSKFDVVEGNLLLPGCTPLDNDDCLLSLETNSDGSWRKADYVGQAPGSQIAADETIGLPNSGGVSLWKISGNETRGEQLLAAHLDLSIQWHTGLKKFKFKSFDLAVVPYELKSGSFRVPEPHDFVDSLGMNKVGVYGFPGECIWVSTSQCGKMVEFEDGLKLRVTLKIRSEIGGWLLGRVNYPEVNIRQMPLGQSSITVSGSIVPVPKVFVTASKQDGLKAALQAFPGAIGEPTGVHNMKANQPGVLGALEAFRELAGDSSVGEYSVWSLGSASADAYCSTKNPGFQGFVSTNATYYQATPPALAGGFLNYTVAGYHYGPDKKTPNLGRYDLVMTSKFAKCLYGLKRIPRYATVRIASENGNTSASTAVLSEKNGWLKLAATGFTFSTKTIKIKLK